LAGKGSIFKNKGDADILALPAKDRDFFFTVGAYFFFNSNLLPEVISGGRLLPLRFQL